MKDINITTIGILAILGYVVFKKNVPPTIELPKAIYKVNTIK